MSSYFPKARFEFLAHSFPMELPMSSDFSRGRLSQWPTGEVKSRRGTQVGLRMPARVNRRSQSRGYCSIFYSFKWYNSSAAGSLLLCTQYSRSALIAQKHRGGLHGREDRDVADDRHKGRGGQEAIDETSPLRSRCVVAWHGWEIFYSRLAVKFHLSTSASTVSTSILWGQCK